MVQNTEYWENKRKVATERLVAKGINNPTENQLVEEMKLLIIEELELLGSPLLEVKPKKKKKSKKTVLFVLAIIVAIGTIIYLVTENL